MKKSSFIHLIIAASFTTLIACQKIKKAEQASFSDWQKVEEDELKTLEKEAGGKLKSILNCRVRPVENYHIYYSLDFLEKATAKDTKQDNTPIKLYEEAIFGNYFYGNSNKTNNKTKIKTKKVKVLVKKEELINTYEVYEKVDSSQITRAEEEDIKKIEEKKKQEEEAKKKQSSEQ
ncbi:MAG: hypothetical protein L6Q37_04345, partial [Bdellovibrionaceae bacterium]|nr:hypothetical protein [Pseudobdellovibrionaceae bacterium]